MTVDHCAGRTAEGQAVEWVSRSAPISVRALQIMVAMESEDLGLTSAEAHRLAGNSEPLLFARTEG